MTFGITTTGFNRKRLSDIKTEIETALKVAFGDNIDLDAQSGFGQFIGILSEAQSLEWESQELVYNSEYPHLASGVSLSNAVKFNGLTRLKGVKSTVTETLTSAPGTVVASGTRIATSDTGSVFVTLTDATIGGGGTVDVNMESEEVDAIEADAGTLTDIKTPVFGLVSASNALAAIVGRAEETDTELRKRQSETTQASGKNNADSLFGQLKNTTGVIDALVLENKTDTVDSNGIPPHQFECIVESGQPEDIADVVWANTPQGINSHGDESETVVDEQGFNQTVYFTRPIEVPIYIDIEIVTDTDKFPTTGESDIKENVVDYGQSNFQISDDVLYSRFFTPINETPGVLSITLTIGTAPAPTGTVNIPIAINEISSYDIANVGVTIV